MSKIWVLVADRSRARFFSAEKPVSQLVEVDGIMHEKGRMKEGELTSDGPGTSSSASGIGGHAMAGEKDARQHEAQIFAKEIFDMLHEAQEKHCFQHLYLVSDPGFLGILRQKIPGSLKPLVKQELNLNIASQSPDQIRKHLPEYL